MVLKNGMQSVTKSRRALALSSVCRKPKKDNLISSLSGNSHLNVLTVLILCRLWVHLVEF